MSRSVFMFMYMCIFTWVSKSICISSATFIYLVSKHKSDFNLLTFETVAKYLAKLKLLKNHKVHE